MPYRIIMSVLRQLIFNPVFEFADAFIIKALSKFDLNKDNASNEIKKAANSQMLKLR